MSDARLRELERRWLASGAHEDGEALVEAGVRSCSPPALLAKELIAAADALGASSSESESENLFGEWLEWVYTLGIWRRNSPASTKDPALAYARERTAEWANQEPHLWELNWRLFEGDTVERVRAFTSEADFYRLPSVPWRRSAYLFAREELALADVSEWLEEDDQAYAHSISVQGEWRDVDVPNGIPRAHYWWWGSSPEAAEGEGEIKQGPYRQAYRNVVAPIVHPLRLTPPI